jgi:hypothetical protein
MRAAASGLRQTAFRARLQDRVEHRHFFALDALVFGARQRIGQRQRLQFLMRSHS